MTPKQLELLLAVARFIADVPDERVARALAAVEQEELERIAIDDMAKEAA